MAFANQIRGDVPNQMSLPTQQNKPGLGIWGRAMFNFPRFQTPGAMGNFLSQFGPPNPGEQADLTSNGQAGEGAKFSINRQVPNDPIGGIMGDMATQLRDLNMGLGGVNGSGGVPQQLPQQPTPGLKSVMLGRSHRMGFI